jgi:hypothetical protein
VLYAAHKSCPEEREARKAVREDGGSNEGSRLLGRNVDKIA